MLKDRIARYISEWTARGYPDDIPDEVPAMLMHLCLAPSYKAICIAILKHDHRLESLGFQPAREHAYARILKARKLGIGLQMRMFEEWWIPERSTTLRYTRLDGGTVLESRPRQ